MNSFMLNTQHDHPQIRKPIINSVIDQIFNGL